MLSFCDIHDAVSGELIYGLFSTFVVIRLKDFSIRSQKKKRNPEPKILDSSQVAWKRAGSNLPRIDSIVQRLFKSAGFWSSLPYTGRGTKLCGGAINGRASG
jgi:hypothetical protein